MTKRPIIGVTPLFDYERDSLWMLPGYMDGVEETGGLPLMLPLTADAGEIRRLADLCDGILFTGGQDVDPAIYGGEITPEYQAMEPELSAERDAMEPLLLDAAIRLDKPVLGICRGIQLINARLGGTLWHDLPSEHPSDVEHHMKPPYDAFGHMVTVEPGTPMDAMLNALPQSDMDAKSMHRNVDGGWTIAVNSYHHQAVKRIAPSLRRMAIAEDGITEAVYRPGSRFLWAVQWHPEFLHEVDARSRAIFSALVNAAA
ncbi:gamma-glutamyl-gamma-aminobutyrate hydrolase family protein [Bifidobacterium moukalabense]|uniref:gamma-glutamyl-gamma-aminobutyrate hydrolase family protein n=1 Tax=Bifidobacterium moukalabense TaxID=1333651 RepID=UPI0010F75761|nr:gamma-glutamyl-gamma-aminobutyrate hydrolase family protein [Bifidobacterium moukalabense]